MEQHDLLLGTMTAESVASSALTKRSTIHKKAVFILVFNRIAFRCIVVCIMPNTSKNPPKTRGRPFEPGNKFGKGRPAGSRNKATLVLEALIDDEGEDVVRAMVTQAKAGNMGAARALLDRLVPSRKDRPVPLTLPPITCLSDAVDGLGEILDGLAMGEITPMEAHSVMGVLAGYVKILEATEFEQRLAALEEKFADGKQG